MHCRSGLRYLAVDYGLTRRPLPWKVQHCEGSLASKMRQYGTEGSVSIFVSERDSAGRHDRVPTSWRTAHASRCWGSLRAPVVGTSALGLDDTKDPKKPDTPSTEQGKSPAVQYRMIDDEAQKEAQEFWQAYQKATPEERKELQRRGTRSWEYAGVGGEASEGRRRHRCSGLGGPSRGF
jgi:hypothetical protein